MWERCVRRYIGNAGVIRRLSGFQMRIFNTVGETVVVKGRVLRKWIDESGGSGDDNGAGLVELEIWSENSKGVSVGPGRMVAALPLRKEDNT